MLTFIPLGANNERQSEGDRRVKNWKFGSKYSFLKYYILPFIGSPFYHPIFWHKIHVFGKMSTYYEDLLDISANVNNFFLDSLQLILAITPHIPHCTISCKIINDFIDPLSSSDRVNFLTILFQ